MTKSKIIDGLDAFGTKVSVGNVIVFPKQGMTKQVDLGFIESVLPKSFSVLIPMVASGGLFWLEKISRLKNVSSLYPYTNYISHLESKNFAHPYLLGILNCNKGVSRDDQAVLDFHWGKHLQLLEISKQSYCSRFNKPNYSLEDYLSYIIPIVLVRNLHVKLLGDSGTDIFKQYRDYYDEMYYTGFDLCMYSLTNI